MDSCPHCDSPISAIPPARYEDCEYYFTCHSFVLGGVTKQSVHCIAFTDGIQHGRALEIEDIIQYFCDKSDELSDWTFARAAEELRNYYPRRND